MYEHAAELGALRLGSGARARLRFELESSVARSPAREAESQPADPVSQATLRPRRRRRVGTNVELLPISASRRTCSFQSLMYTDPTRPSAGAPKSRADRTSGLVPGQLHQGQGAALPTDQETALELQFKQRFAAWGNSSGPCLCRYRRHGRRQPRWSPGGAGPLGNARGVVSARRRHLHNQIDFGYPTEDSRAREREISVERQRLHRRIDELRELLSATETGV